MSRDTSGKGNLFGGSKLLHRVWIDHTVDVDASPDALFSLLSGLDKWDAWTPGLVSILRGSRDVAKEGSRFVMVLSFPVLRRIVLPCQIYSWNKDCLEWGGGFLGSRIRHSFELMPLIDGRTRLRHVEYATGLLALLFRPFEEFAYRHDLTWSEAIQQRFA